MKKLLIITALTLALSGCASNTTDTVFSLTDEQTTAYKADIADILSKDSWGYNPDTITFTQSELPAKDDSIYTLLDTFTSDGCLKASTSAGKPAVLATVPLQHINGNNVGTAYFYFLSDEPVCSYYMYNNKYYVLNSKNPFELSDVLTTYENTDRFAAFTYDTPSTTTKASFTSAYAINKGIIATVADDNTARYYDGANKFKLTAKNDFTGRGLFPLDITLGDDFGTILLGESIDVQQSENENEDSDIINDPPSKSVSIAITDSNGKAIGKEIPTTVSSFSSLTQVGNSLFLARDKSIDEFTYDNNTLTKVKTYMLDHYVSQIRTADIDGNGTVEFIVSDGTNIYIYEKNSTFNLVWRSNSYLSSISGNIYVGDLNNDGVKELYVTDSLGVTARYVLTAQGFKINGGGVMSGDDKNYIIADFNNDNLCDYMVVEDDAKNAQLYTMSN
jgi:hypothetical protein